MFSFINSDPSDDYINSIKNNTNMSTYEIVDTNEEAQYEYVIWAIDGYFNTAILDKALAKVDGLYNTYCFPSLRHIDSSTIKYCDRSVLVIKRSCLNRKEPKTFKTIECDWLFYEKYSERVLYDF